ncbi:hypothetical protein RJ639_032324 [Escallonia herrerae]|uniref:Pentatricopeptide repeat-containing protein n=1 Tax=Escallonia herrerae TaxID=1293975 RepID=A0AA88WXS9_9ASTE|nr:hypothetical protein RJ639_032324 [Escallonia herrerae]
MDPPNCFSWNTIIRALSESDDQNDDDPFQALVLFRLMLVDELVEPNRFTFPSVLKACAKTGRVEEGKQVHGMVVKIGLEDDEFVPSNLVRMYVMCGAMEYAHVLFNSNKVNVERKTQMGGTVLWNVMVDGFNGLFKEAIELFRDMQMGDTRPNYVTLVSVLPAISRLGALELGKWVHLYAERNGIGIDEVLGSALIDMYSKCGSIDKVLQLFESLSQKNVITWNAILGGLAMHNRGKDAVDFFSKMQQVGVGPSEVTYISVLTACSHAGLVQEVVNPFSITWLK